MYQPDMDEPFQKRTGCHDHGRRKMLHADVCLNPDDAAVLNQDLLHQSLLPTAPCLLRDRFLHGKPVSLFLSPAFRKRISAFWPGVPAGMALEPYVNGSP